MATYLVTGVAGFIGSQVAKQLLDNGHQVVGIDNLNEYYDVRLKDFRLSKLLRTKSSENGSGAVTLKYKCKDEFTCGNFTFWAVDIEDREALDRIFAKYRFSAVLNLAARAGVRASIENPFVFLSTNTVGTLNILECQRKYGVPKLVLASTSSLYAGNPMPFTEILPVNTPLSPYAAAKKAAELMAYTYHRLYKVDVMILRYFTVIGPAGRPDMALFRFIKWIDEGSPITIYGDGSQGRDFTYVDDVARGTISALNLSGYEIINLGGGNKPISILNLISLIEDLLNKKAIVTHKPFNEADMHETWADISKAELLLKWKPQIDVKHAVASCVEWHIANREWLRTTRV